MNAQPVEIRRLNPAVFLTLPDGTARDTLPNGWDAADALTEGYTAALIAERLTSIADPFPPFVQSPSVAMAEAAKVSSCETAKSNGARFYVDARGVWCIGTGKDGEPTESKVCATLDVVGRARTANYKEWGKLVEFLDHDGQQHREVIPDSLLSGDGAEIGRLLRGLGLWIAAGRNGNVRLLEYLNSVNPAQRARITTRTGWHESENGRVFVLPDRAIGKADELWLFDGGVAAADYRACGTLGEWQREVAALCVGNSRLVFAVSLAFAAPLLDLVGGENGGIHYAGESGDGKTTALRVAASVCGGSGYLRTWRATDNAMESVGMQHCDTLLALDELAQVNAKSLGDMIYMLGNASGKSRSRAQGGLRETVKFRLLFLSTGEVGIASHVESVGMKSTAGMEGRMAEIPARVSDNPPGIYEELHGESSPKALSQRLVHAVKNYHGTALPLFLAELAKRDPEEIRETLLKGRKLFAERYLSNEAGNQVLRVADRCALVGAAGELATSWKITGWPKGEAISRAGICFQAWLKHRGGEGNQEEKAMIAQVRAFLNAHHDGRFVDWRRPTAKDTHAARVMTRAGFKRLVDPVTGRLADLPRPVPGEEPYIDDSLVTEYLIQPDVFRSEVCKGFNPSAVAKLLASRGFLKTEKEHLAVKIKPPGESSTRMFHVLPAIFDMD